MAFQGTKLAARAVGISGLQAGEDVKRYMLQDVARYMVWEKREGAEMIRHGIFDSFEAARDWCDAHD